MIYAILDALAAHASMAIYPTLGGYGLVQKSG
jgi:hypothetical protein